MDDAITFYNTSKSPFLLGGTGYVRRVSLLQGGQRYVPKGGHVVDFSTRKVPKRGLKKNDESTEVFHVVQDDNKVATANNNQTPPSINVVSTARTIQQCNQPTASTPRLMKQSKTFKKESGELPTQQRQWRPPGRANVVKNQQANATLHDKKYTQGCISCMKYEKIQQEIQEELNAAKQNRAAINQLRGKLEVALATALKEKKEFDKYKESEVARLQKAAAEISRKAIRDRMAREARQRAKSQQEAHLNGKKEIQALQNELDKERHEASEMKIQHTFEIENLQRRIDQLENKNAELKCQLDSAACMSSEETDDSTTCTPTEELSTVTMSDKTSSTTNATSHCVVRLDSSTATLQSTKCSPSASFSSSSSASPPLSTTSANGNSMIDIDKEKEASISSLPFPLSPRTLKAPRTMTKRYDNGTIQNKYPDGHSITHYTNGDIKQEYPSGIVEYLFKGISCWQVTHPSGIDVYYFPSGQVEAHLPGGIKEILLPNNQGALKSWPSGGGEVTVSPTLLCREILWPKPVILIR